MMRKEKDSMKWQKDRTLKDESKILSGQALRIAVKRKEAKSKGIMERYSHLNAEFQRIARRD